jgi:hypothetical protein
LYEVIFDQSYISGIEVSSFIASFQPPPEIVAHLYKEIFRLLKEKIHIHRKRTRNKRTLELSYFSKIEKRLALSRKTAPNVFTDLLGSEFVWIDGEKYLNIGSLLEEFRGHSEFQDVLEPPFHCLTMGDTNTENIKICNITPILKAMETRVFNFTYDDIELKFLDPRAIGFESSGSETVDDYMYDSKPFHNSLGNYDVIHNEHFSVNISYKDSVPHIKIEHKKNHPFQKSYNDIGRYFKFVMEEGQNVNDPKFLQEDPHWLIRFVFIMGTHFAAMPPFHFRREITGSLVDDLYHQKRPVALYCEGIKWLNWAFRMLEGKLTEFHGVEISELPCR